MNPLWVQKKTSDEEFAPPHHCKPSHGATRMNAYSQSSGTSTLSATQEAHDANGCGNGLGIDLPTGLLTIGQCSRLFGLSICKIRLEVKAGKIPCIRLPSNHRRFAPSSFLPYLGMEQGKSSGSNKGLRISLMGRVSGAHEQVKKNDEGTSQLDRQMDRLRLWSKEHHPDAHITEYVRKSSGLNLGCKVLLQCLTNIMLHKADMLVLTNTERLCRWGREIIELICRFNNCKLIFIEESIDKTEEMELTEDLMAIIHIFAARKMGLRSAKNNQANPTPIVLNKILTWAFKDKMSSYAITAKLKETGDHLDPRGKSLSRRVVRRLIDSNKALADSFSMSNSPASSSGLKEFCKEHVRKTIGGKRNLQFGKLVKMYRDFAKAKGLNPVSNRAVERFLIKNFVDCPITKDPATNKRTIAGIWIHK
jgi:putative resolvase